MHITPFAGLTVPDPGESLSVNGYAFTSRDPVVVDRLLQVGAVTHRHDGHERLADPTALPVVNVFSGGGALPPGMSLSVGYTWLDFDGGETAMSEAVTVSTPAPIDEPQLVPTTTVVSTSGALRAGLYYYTLTLKDANGGETTAGASFPVTIPQGSNTNSVQIGGLAALLTDGAVHWVLYRSDGGGKPQYMVEGSADSFTDDGINCAVSINPPVANTTRGDSYLGVTVPAPDPEEVSVFRIYLDVDGAFDSPCLLGEYPLASAAAPLRVNTVDVLDGAPPFVSQTLPGAMPIQATDIGGLTWAAPVASVGDLPSAGVVDGEARIELSSPPALHVWVDGAWSAISGEGGGSGGDSFISRSVSGTGGGDMNHAADWGAIFTWGDVVGNRLRANTELSSIGLTGYYGAYLSTPALPPSPMRRVTMKIGTDSNGVLNGGTPAVNGGVAGLNFREKTDLTLGVSATINVEADGKFSVGCSDAEGNGSYGPTDVSIPTLEPSTDYWIGICLYPEGVFAAMWDQDPGPEQDGVSNMVSTQLAFADNPETDPEDFIGRPLHGVTLPVYNTVTVTGVGGMAYFTEGAGAAGLVISIPGGASAGIFNPDGHSPWELAQVAAGPSAVVFPKRLELVAGAGITIGLASGDDDTARITIGLA